MLVVEGKVEWKGENGSKRLHVGGASIVNVLGAFDGQMVRIKVEVIGNE